MEIERKFLIKQNCDFKAQAITAYHIAQGYMDVKDATVRIRFRTEISLKDGKELTSTAFLTIKGKSMDGGLSRYEFEREIPLDDAKEMPSLLISRYVAFLPSAAQSLTTVKFDVSLSPVPAATYDAR